VPQAAIVWLALLLLVLLVLLVITARRMSSLIARTRALESFQSATIELDAALGRLVDPLVAQLDEIRRRAGDPVSLARGIDTTQAELRSLVTRGRELRPPKPLADEAAALLAELDRASRAADLVEHGLDALIAHRGHRELEAQTSLKRAALNLRNARGAAAAIVRRVAAVTPADLLARPDGRETVQVRAPAAIGFDAPDLEDEGAPHPRM
jgi:hypothetical protein